MPRDEAKTALGFAGKPPREAEGEEQLCRASGSSLTVCDSWETFSGHFPLSAPAPRFVSIVTMHEEISIRTAECGSKQRWRPLES